SLGDFIVAVVQHRHLVDEVAPLLLTCPHHCPSSRLGLSTWRCCSLCAVPSIAQVIDAVDKGECLSLRVPPSNCKEILRREPPPLEGHRACDAFRDDCSTRASLSQQPVHRSRQQESRTTHRYVLTP